MTVDFSTDNQVRLFKQIEEDAKNRVGKNQYRVVCFPLDYRSRKKNVFFLLNNFNNFDASVQQINRKSKIVHHESRNICVPRYSEPARFGTVVNPVLPKKTLDRQTIFPLLQVSLKSQKICYNLLGKSYIKLSPNLISFMSSRAERKRISMQVSVQVEIWFFIVISGEQLAF